MTIALRRALTRATSMDQGGVCWPGRIRLAVKTHRIVTSIELVTGNRRYA
ncbi:MAG: hypothetical protein JWP70_617 [Leifsonia sp.]|jgi:hypothetical protein|nr:hypothetical protein [Leifsonia sp.]MDQ1589242.1 hypothetical protein [Microbacteriaceae bacterium]